MSQDERPQRLRATYRKAEVLRYIAHLDLMRTWERSLRRARLPLAYTQGFTPHARIALGAPLPVGTVGERELLDVWMSPAIAPEEFARRLAAVLPEGLVLLAAEEAAHELPSLQSQIRSATYEVTFAHDAFDVADTVQKLTDGVGVLVRAEGDAALQVQPLPVGNRGEAVEVRGQEAHVAHSLVAYDQYLVPGSLHRVLLRGGRP